jgi:hypothetical protein
VLPRLGHPVAKDFRTHVINHHTAGVDDDETPNIWETEAEIKAYMRRLQTLRTPTLGADVPYSYVAFPHKSGVLYVCEGRGEDRSGAHTKFRDDNGFWHNESGIGFSWAGNYEAFTFDSHYLAPASSFFGWLRDDRGMVNLGAVHPPGRDTYGHRDIQPTACPGKNLFNEIGDLTIGEDMKPHLVKESNSQFVWIVFGNSKAYLRDMAHARVLGIDTTVETVPAGTLSSIARLY